MRNGSQKTKWQKWAKILCGVSRLDGRGCSIFLLCLVCRKSFVQRYFSYFVLKYFWFTFIISETNYTLFIYKNQSIFEK